MSSSRKNILAANGFGRGSLTVAEAWALYHARYTVPPDMRLPSSGGWRMAVNGVGVPPPLPGAEHWRDAIRTHRARLSAEDRADPTWTPTGNDDWWGDFFQAQHDAEMNSTDGLVGQRNTWNKEGRVRFWVVPRRTLQNVVDSIHRGAARLDDRAKVSDLSMRG